MDAKEMNGLAVAGIQNLRDNAYFENLNMVDDEIKSNQNPLDKAFYLTKQDELTSIYGELKNTYAELYSKLKKYIVVRKLQFRVDLEKNKQLTVNGEVLKPSREPGGEVLEDYARAEVSELYEACILLEGWIEHCENSLRTTRSHVYGGEQKVGGNGAGEERPNE